MCCKNISYSRPHSTDSATHRKMTLSLADRCSKTQKIRILPMAGRDPESHRNEMIKVTHFSDSVHLRWCVCLSSALSEITSVTTGIKRNKGHIRPSVDKRHAQLHKGITWRAYIMRSHHGQWNGDGVSKSREEGWLCINCQPKQFLIASHSFTVLSYCATVVLETQLWFQVLPDFPYTHMF